MIPQRKLPSRRSGLWWRSMIRQCKTNKMKSLMWLENFPPGNLNTTSLMLQNKNLLDKLPLLLTGPSLRSKILRDMQYKPWILLTPDMTPKDS